MGNPDYSGETHPETFYDIQEEKTATLCYLMTVLVVLYTSFFWVAFIVLHYSMSDSLQNISRFTLWPTGSWYVLSAGVLVAVFHYFRAYYRDIRPELARLGVMTPDDDDQYHRIFANVLDEMKVATGRTDVEGYVLPTRYRTALSLEDRNNAAVIITEGSLGVLDRHEIQAVVAHEMAHVAYGDTAVKTFIHKMVSFVDTLNDDAFDDRPTDWGYSRYNDRGFTIGHITLVLVSYGYEFLLRLLSTTISKERERRADATAVEYNRNPIALAGALHKLGSYYRQSSLKAQQYRAFDYLKREDFDSLQIVPVDLTGINRSSFLDDVFNTHPPLDERIDTLLDLANTPRENLENQVAGESTPSFETNCVTAADGEPIVEKSFWMENNGEKSGPLSFSELLQGDRFDPESKIGYSPEGSMQPMGSLPLFQYLFDLARAGDMNHDCPECEGPLQSDSYLGVPLVTCPICGGVGLNKDRMLRVACRYQDKDLESEALKDFAHTPAHDEQPEEEFELTKDCPECGGSFEKSFYTGMTSLIVDTCRECGFVWFENGELQVACEIA